MNSPFQQAFSAKSPLRKHKGLQRKLKKAEAGKIGAEGQGGIDYELVADLERQIKDAKTAHNTNKRTEEGDAQVVEDEASAQSSAIEMKSPLHGYVDASDMVDPNPPTAHMWTKVFDSMQTAGLGIVDAKASKAKTKKQKADLKRIDTKDDDGKLYTQEDYYIDYPQANAVKCPGTQKYNPATGNCE